MVPQVAIGSIGGSGTWGARFPEDLGRKEVRVLEYLEPISTPFGQSSPLKLLEIGGKQVLRAAMHGWHRDEASWVPTWTCALQLAWVFQEAGVEWALVDGSVGGIQTPDGSGAPLPPWSVVITDDFIQYWLPPTAAAPIAVRVNGGLRMREPFCAGLRCHLMAAASRQPQFTVYDRGVYVCTPPGRFETAAEIRIMAGWGAHIVGQTLGHEAPLMRQLGIHFGSLNIVSNFAEGNDGWIGESANAMEQFYRSCPQPVGNALIDAMLGVIESGIGECHCAVFRLDGLGNFPVEGA